MEKYDEIKKEQDILKLAEKVGNEFEVVDIRFNGVKNAFNSLDEKILELNAKINYLNILIEKNSNVDLDKDK